MPNKLSIWWRSLRAYSLPMTLLPILCAFLYARATGSAVEWPLFPLMLFSGTLLHAGTNLLNDYYDYTLGFDTEEASGSSGVIQEKLIPAGTVLFYGRLYLALGCLFALPLVLVRGPMLLVFGTLGACGAFFYSHRQGYKYKGLGEPAVFLLMGPLLFLSAFFTAAGTLSVDALLPASAFGCLVTAVLLTNNIRDEQMDRRAGFTTLPMRIGPDAGRNLVSVLIIVSLIIPPLLVIAGRLSWPALLPLLSAPPALKQIKQVQTAAHPAEDLKTAPQQTAMLCMMYGLLFAAGIFFCN